jgi:hypothetical protein
LREIPYDELEAGVGVYTVGEEGLRGDMCPDLVYQPNPEQEVNEIVYGCPHLTAVFDEYSEKLLEAEADGRLPDLHATFTVQQVQPQLIRVEPHVQWTDPESGQTKTYSNHYYLHANRATEE